MEDTNLSIKIFDDIYDAELKAAWIKLQHENDVFPQMYYEWIEPWIRLRFGKRKLYIISVIKNNEIITLAPFCIEKKFGIKVLRSLPIHFGDFYELIGNTSSDLLNYLFSALTHNRDFHVINIQNLNNKNVSYNSLIKYNFIKNLTSDIVYTRCDKKDLSELINSLSKNQRKSLRRRLKRISEVGELKLNIITTEEQYLNYEPAMKDIFYKRWEKGRTRENEQIFNNRKISFTNCLNKKKSLGFVLLLNEKLIAYCLGFNYLTEFRSWKLVYDNEYASYSPGIIITAKILNYLTNNNIEYYNHGNGFYSYKLEWFNSNILTANYQFMHANKLLGKIYISFENKWKVKIKKKLKK